MRESRGNKKGLSLMEVILVVVIVGVVAALAAPNVRIGIENRQAVQATETLKSIAHAVRMYQADHDGSLPADLKALEDAGYLNSTEYAYKRKPGDTDSNGYEYSITTSPKCVVAEQYVIVTTTKPGECKEVCYNKHGCCDICDWICDPPIIIKTKKSIGTLKICED